MSVRRLRLILAASAVVVLALGVAGGAEGKPDSVKLDKIVFGTGFGVLGRDAFIHVAVEKGFFREQGIEVEIVPGAGTVDTMKQIAAGRRDVGWGDFNALVLTRANEGIPVKAVYIISQDVLSAYIALRESGMTKPKDLEGKTIADAPGSTATVLFPLYAKKAGIDASKVKFVPAAPPALPSLLASKKVDAIAQFILGLPLIQKAAGGKPLVSFPYFKYFPGFVGTAIMVSDDMIAKNPDLLRRIVAAVDKGLHWAIDNPGAAGAIINKMVPLVDPVVAAQELKLLKPHVRTPFTLKNGYGAFDRNRVNSTISIVTNFFKPKNPVTADDTYTDKFLPKKK